MSKFIMPDGREYPIEIRNITNKESTLLKKVSGYDWEYLCEKVIEPEGKTAFLWLAMRKNGHHVPFDELEFPMGSTKLVIDEEDPTPGSQETPEPTIPEPQPSSSTKSTKSRSGPRTKRA